MSVLNALVTDLKELSPEQLGAVAAYVREIHKAGSTESDGGLWFHINAPGGAVVQASALLVERLGESPLGKNLAELCNVAERGAVEKLLLELSAGKALSNVPTGLKSAGGNSLPLILSASKGLGTDVRVDCRESFGLAAVTEQSERRNQETEENLRTALQFSRAAVWHWNAASDEARWAGPVEEIFGKSEAELSTFSAFKASVMPSDLKTIERKAIVSLATGCDIESEFRYTRPDGKVVWIAGRGGVLRDPDGRIFGIAGVNFDITRRKSIEQELARSSRDFRELTNVVPQIVFIADANGHIDYLNKGYFNVTGDSRADDTGFYQAVFEDDREPSRKLWVECVRSGKPFEAQLRIWDCGYHAPRWYLARAVPIRDENGCVRRWFGTATDIHDHKTSAARLEYEVECRVADLNHSLTLLKEREEQLRRSLLEKDMLMREIHHRVKNNLQIISSLLRIQAAGVVDPTTINALRDAERRVSSMAMLHEQLYGRSDMTIVDFGEHAQRLAQSLMASVSPAHRLRCCLDLQPVQLCMDQAIPCALILNELLTNAVKHAYPDNELGDVTIQLKCEREMVTLSVSDRGVGMPREFDPKRPKTLGLEIVNVLARQVDGELEVISSHGATLRLCFRRQMPAGSQEIKEVLYEQATN